MRTRSSIYLLLLGTTAFACSGEDQLGIYQPADGTGARGGYVGEGTTGTTTGTTSGATTGTTTTGTSTGSGGGEREVLRYETVCYSTCTDDPPPQQNGNCADWKEWGQCGTDWFKDYCQETCGTCTDGKEVCEDVPIYAPEEEEEGGNYTNPGQDAGPLPGNAQSGWASRYWDCCKPHCAWSENSPGGAMKMCTLNNAPLSDANATSSCADGGGPAHTCWNMAPYAVSSTLAYGYAATPAGGNDCGKCYQLEFTGTGHHNANDAGSRSLAGKTMIVQSTNIGGDVGTGQFDIMIPGGGVGRYNGCANQWGTSDLGADYGGFLTACNDDVNCLKNKCQEVFNKTGMEDLLAGCIFHVEWMKGANNPNLRYAEVDCPAELEGISGMAR